jgi:hypothetical protein
MAFVGIKDNTKLVRDTHSKAVLNTDKNGLNEYLMKRQLAKQELEEKNESKMRLAKLEDDMRDIKNLLVEIVALRKE